MNPPLQGYGCKISLLSNNWKVNGINGIGMGIFEQILGKL
jgi:hypothetical protein